MVKRIRKRKIKESAAPEGATPEGEEDAAAGGGLRAELDALADDEFTQKTVKGFQWLLDNRVMVLAVLGSALVGLISLSVYQRVSRTGAEEASAALQAATDVYLKAHGQTGDPADKPLEGEARTGQLERSRDAFVAARNRHGDSAISALARLGEASANYDLGQHEAALKAYNAVLATPELDPFARAIALQGKAATLESSGKAEGAMKAWRSIEALDKQAYGVLAGLQVGRLLEAEGKSAEAIKHYEALKKTHEKALKSIANSRTRADIDRRIERLGGPS